MLGIAPLATRPLASALGEPQTYNIAAAAGAYTLSGQAVALRAARAITAAAGAYTYTGQGVTLRIGLGLIVGAGAYALTGQNVVLFALPKVYAELGTYVLTGKDIGIVATHKIFADVGAYTLTGKAVTFKFRLDAMNSKYIRLEGFHDYAIALDGYYIAPTNLGGIRN